MQIKTFRELIDWTRDLHANLARSFSHCANKHQEERARALLDYLATHESEIERIVSEFEHQADDKALETRVYDYLSNDPVETHRTCNEAYDQMDEDGICREVFDFHDQIIGLYKSLIGKSEIPEAKELFESMLTMEENESMRLARQVGRLNEI